MASVEKYKIGTCFDDKRKVMGWGATIWKDGWRWKLIPTKYKTEKKAMLVALDMIREDIEVEEHGMVDGKWKEPQQEVQ